MISAAVARYKADLSEINRISERIQVSAGNGYYRLETGRLTDDTLQKLKALGYRIETVMWPDGESVEKHVIYW